MEYYLGILIALVGALVLVWAFVRPRRGTEPHCRRCRFSLAGLTEPKVCPECGRDLSRKRAVVTGLRPRKLRAFEWCALCAIIGGSLIGLDHMNRSGFLKLTQYKPAFLLQLEAYTLDDLRASMATDEIVDRLFKGKLGTDAQDRLVKTALARHAQTWRSFPSAQWQVITTAMGRNELSFEQIERLWNDSFQNARLDPLQHAQGGYAPGESIDCIIRYDARAGELRAAGLGNAGFALRTTMHVGTTNDAGEFTSNARFASRGTIIQKSPGPMGGRPLDYTMHVRFDAPESLGKHRYEARAQIEFDSAMVARNWPNITSDQLDRLASLEHSLTFPFTVEVVEPETLNPPVAEPTSLASDPISLIDFQVAQWLRIGDLGSDHGIMYRVGTNASLDPAIGLGGRLVFEQEGRIASGYIGYNLPHQTTQAFTPLPGFVPGEVRVRYEHDLTVARNNRDKMTRVLGGPIDLGNITIPEPEPIPELEPEPE